MPRPRQKWLQRLRDSPDMKILYLHGFASSGNNGSVKLLRSLLPDVEFISPDIPVEPAEALPFLQELCAKEDPDLVIGTSMGGMYAEQLTGRYRILVNPDGTEEPDGVPEDAAVILLSSLQSRCSRTTVWDVRSSTIRESTDRPHFL